MNYLDLTLPSVAENLALDEALLLQTEEQGAPEVLRFWEWPSPAVILGAGSKFGEDANEDACRRDGVPILRRSSGGGTVLLDGGCLCYSLVLRVDRDPALADVRRSFAYILERVRACLVPVIAEVQPAGTSDLAVAARKFSGNAQQRKRHALLHHGTLLHGLNFDRVEKYLANPARQPEYRLRRSHAAFLMNLSLPAVAIRERLRHAWEANDVLTTWPALAVRRLVQAQYARTAWTRRR